MKILKIFLLAIFLIFLSSSVALAANLGDAFRVNDGSNSDNLDSMANRAGYNTKANANPLDSTIATVIKTGLSFLGVIFILLMIYGGYLWMTDQGNEEQVARAKQLITAAITGLIIVVSSYAISYFVIKSFSNKTLDSENEFIPGSGIDDIAPDNNISPA